MKYTIFQRILKNGTALLEPVIFPDHVSHNSIKIEGATPVSAAFFGITTHRVFGHSTSLNLHPHKDDRDILSRACLGAGTMGFVVQEPREVCIPYKEKTHE